MSDKTKTEPIVVNVVQPDRAAEGAQAILDGQALRMDYAENGGRYIVGDKTVDADGKEVT